MAAKALAFRGMSEDVLHLLAYELPASLANSEIAADKQILEASAYTGLHRFPEADLAISQADTLCATFDRLTGDLLKTEGLLEIQKGNYDRAESTLLRALIFARRNQDQFLESLALLDLGQTALLRQRFDEAIDWSNNAFTLAKSIEAQLVTETAVGNLGWALYKTGDPERALDLFLQAQARAKSLGSIRDEVLWLTTAGYVYLDDRKFNTAEDLYQKALDLAIQINSKEDILNAQISLASVNVLIGNLELAQQYADQAITSARADRSRIDELYPLLTNGQVSARRGDNRQAEQIFSEIANDTNVNPSLKWEAQHQLANLFATQNKTTQALAAYLTTIKTFETARSEIQHEDVKLPFLSNASGLYDDYINLLLSKHKFEDALYAADHARARTLSEGLGQLKKTESALPPSLEAQRIARASGGSILYYWIGQKQSYLWAITPQKTTLYTLPAAPQIDALVKSYRKALERPQAGVEEHTAEGTKLYRMLVQPAAQVIGKSSRVFIVPDGTLNGLNFETLVVPDPKPHYWIEDATITNASALRLLERSHSNSAQRRAKLLLVGNPVTPTPEFVTPPQAAAEMTRIEEHFPSNDQKAFSGAAATPGAYLSSRPEQFGYIHFVAHGTASRLSPLDSAIVLSRANPQDESYRLYARDIIQKPLRAELVTISACYGAGTRAYSGEGLVGLSWAFLRAGAHNVIAALWDVSDASTPQLMDQMYFEIRKGKRPEEALRLAKLTLLHSSTSFHNPFYWAPFQLYTGS